jgi:VWFA-related protein
MSARVVALLAVIGSVAGLKPCDYDTSATSAGLKPCDYDTSATSAGLKPCGYIACGDATIQDQAPVYRAGSHVVRVEVSVRRQLRPVTDLAPEEIEILDNGVRQKILDFAYEKKLPIDVTVLLDLSESVTGDMLNQLKRGVQEFRNGLGPADRLKLVAFNSRIVRQFDFLPRDEVSLGDLMRGMSAGGNTSMYDALAVSLVAAADPDRRQLVVVFSDCEDTTSIVQPPLLTEIARRSNAAVFAVLPASVRFSGLAATLLRRSSVPFALAQETGGMVVPVDRGGGLPDTFRRVLEEFRQMYILHFSPAGVEPRGFHTIDLRVTRGGSYQIRTRRGYSWN